MSRRAKVTITVCVGVFMASLDLFIVNIAFPDIQKSFPSSSLSGLSWILNAYAIAFAALLVPAGRWADRAGRKNAFVIGLALFSAASAACAAAPSVQTLIAARAIQAAGAALLFPTSLGLLLPEYPLEKRGAAVGIWSAVSGIAAAAGPPLGGILVQAGWRWVFLVNVPIGIVTLVAAYRLLINTRDEHATGRPDTLGALLFTGGIAALTLGIVQGQSWGWGGGRVLGLWAAALVMLVAVAVRSARHPVPLIDPVIVKTRTIALANLAAIFYFMAFATMLLGIVLYQTEVWHISVLRAGFQTAPGPMTAAAFAFPGGLLGQRYGVRLVGGLGALLFALAGIYFRQHLTATPDYAGALLPSQLMTGAGVGLVLPSLSAAATAGLPPNRFSTGTGVLGMSRQLGSALGIAVFVAILGHPTAATALDGFRNGWDVLIGASAAAALLFVLMGRPQAVPASAAARRELAEEDVAAAIEPAGTLELGLEATVAA